MLADCFLSLTEPSVKSFQAEPTPYYVLMSFMLRGAWDEAVDWMYEYCKKLDADKKGGTEASSLHRFFGLVTSACRILKHGHNVGSSA